MIAGIFERTMKRRGVRESDPFDWEKAGSDSNTVSDGWILSSTQVYIVFCLSNYLSCYLSQMKVTMFDDEKAASDKNTVSDALIPSSI